ncbi:MAG: C_GCAxxG_C_C family protein [Thermoplasmata archaeon]|nr:C_GCAxxG_C_C family protein [Thermoplasmata archaeon]
MKAVKQDTKKLFWKKGTCSQTFFFILNREFDNNGELQERASDPLVGGILQFGYQCGLLIGSTLAVGKESYRRFEDQGQATAMAILASQRVIDAFRENAGSPNCRDITDTDFHNKLQFAKYMVFKARSCYKLADNWTQDAIGSAKEGLSIDPAGLPGNTMSCASEVAKRMGATEEEAIAVAGFAGGLGLSGEACGALIAAIWLRSLEWCRENPGKSAFSNKYASNMLFTFDDATGSEFLCRNICGRKFNSMEEHTEYVRNGGCAKLIDTLASSI